MAKALCLLNDAEWRRIEPLLPRGRRWAHQVDDRRVISGIVYMLRSGGRWRDCPTGCDPYTTVYNRYNRWSRQELAHIFTQALTGHSGIFGTVAIDSTHVKSPPVRRWRKRGTSHRGSAARAGGARRSSTA